MSANKKPRKAYRPRGINPTAHVMAMLGAAWIDDPEIEHRTAVLTGAVDRACIGGASHDDWRAIFDASNVLEALGDLGIASVQGIDAVQSAIEGAMARRRPGLMPALTHSERETLRDLLAAYLSTLPHLTNQDLMRAEERVAQTVRRALAGCGSAVVLEVCA